MAEAVEAESSSEAPALLGVLPALYTRIRELEDRLAALHARKVEIFTTLRDVHGITPKVIGDAFGGVTGEAVSQAIRRTKDRASS